MAAVAHLGVHGADIVEPTCTMIGAAPSYLEAMRQWQEDPLLVERPQARPRPRQRQRQRGAVIP